MKKIFLALMLFIAGNVWGMKRHQHAPNIDLLLAILRQSEDQLRLIHMPEIQSALKNGANVNLILTDKHLKNKKIKEAIGSIEKNSTDRLIKEQGFKAFIGSPILNILTALNQPVLIQDLLKNGADPNLYAKDGALDGFNALHVAILYGLNDIARCFFEQNKIINPNSFILRGIYKGLTALHLSAIYKNPKLTEILLKNSANPNLKALEDALYYSGDTTLHIAAKLAHVEVIMAIFKERPSMDANIKNNKDETPLYCALSNAQNLETNKYNNLIETIKILIQNGASVIDISNNPENTIDILNADANIEYFKQTKPEYVKLISDLIKLIEATQEYKVYKQEQQIKDFSKHSPELKLEEQYLKSKPTQKIERRAQHKRLMSKEQETKAEMKRARKASAKAKDLKRREERAKKQDFLEPGDQDFVGEQDLSQSEEYDKPLKKITPNEKSEKPVVTTKSKKIETRGRYDVLKVESPELPKPQKSGFEKHAMAAEEKLMTAKQRIYDKIFVKLHLNQSDRDKFKAIKSYEKLQTFVIQMLVKYQPEAGWFTRLWRRIRGKDYTRDQKIRSINLWLSCLPTDQQEAIRKKLNK